MKITYIGYGDFHHYAGMKQMFHFAQEISCNGHQTQMLIPGNVGTVSSMAEAPLSEIVQLEFTGPFVSSSVKQRVQTFDPDIIHVWTPRHIPALAGWQLKRMTKAVLLINHEDDEDYHIKHMYYSWTMNWRSGFRRFAIPFIIIKNLLFSWLKPVSQSGRTIHMAQNPISYRGLVKHSNAHTAISPNLLNWVKQEFPNTLVHLLYPGANLDLFKPQDRDSQLLYKLGIQDRKVLVYTGSLDWKGFEWFMALLAGLKEKFPDIFLILVGGGISADEPRLKKFNLLDGHYHITGQVTYSDIPRYLSLADILVQHPLDLGNTLRLPAKLPEYLAMGKPIVTYAQGIGESFTDGVQLRKLYTDRVDEAINVVSKLLIDNESRMSLGAAARQLAQERFSWQKNGLLLMSIYEKALQAS